VLPKVTSTDKPGRSKARVVESRDSQKQELLEAFPE
jgi:hypothetical protein